jgi:phosphoenolpyruvate-protein kinase (PTS system EI component)
MVVQNGHRHKRWVGSCGEMSGDAAVAILLVGLEIDEISTSPLALPKIKKIIRSISFREARAIAQRALEFSSGAEVMEFLTANLKKFARDLIE